MDARINHGTAGRKSVSNACMEPCPIERGMQIVRGKWTGSILWHLREGPVHFNDLSRLLGGASKRMIAARLRELEAHGLVHRDVLGTKPLSVRYEVTDLGRTALGFLDQMRQWAESLPPEVKNPRG